MSEGELTRKDRAAHVAVQGAIAGEAMAALIESGVTFSSTPAAMIDTKRASKATSGIGELPIELAEHYIMPSRKPHSAQCDGDTVLVQEIKSFKIEAKASPKLKL